VIPHARGLPAALASRALAIPVIQATFGAVPMAPARAASAVAAGEAGADRPAVDVAAVAGAADRKDPLAAGARGQAARRRLCHRRSPTAGAAAPRKAPKICDNPRRASVCRTTTSTRPPRTRSVYSGSSLRFRERLYAISRRSEARAMADSQHLPARSPRAGASHRTRPTAAGPSGRSDFLKDREAIQALNSHDR